MPTLRISKDMVMKNLSSFAADVSVAQVHGLTHTLDIGQIVCDHVLAIVLGRFVFMALMHPVLARPSKGAIPNHTTPEDRDPLPRDHTVPCPYGHAGLYPPSSSRPWE